MLVATRAAEGATSIWATGLAKVCQKTRTLRSKHVHAAAHTRSVGKLGTGCKVVFSQRTGASGSLTLAAGMQTHSQGLNRLSA